MEKKVYEKAEAEIVSFSASDIIAASGNASDNGGQLPEEDF